MNRSNFLRTIVQAGAVALACPLTGWGSPDGRLPDEVLPDGVLMDEALMERLSAANDAQVTELLKGPLGGQAVVRKTGYDFAALAAAYCHERSGYYRSPAVITALQKLGALLRGAQSADGTLNFANLESPPDTAFLLEPLAAGMRLLGQAGTEDARKVLDDMHEFFTHCADALAAGGVHTPNHRWLVCSALARCHALLPERRYLDRIGDWLGEGVFIDKDGHYSERSVNYAVVENSSLLTIGRLLEKPALFGPVRKNLEMTWYYMDPNGELATVDSRRQDQYKSKSIVPYYLFYRYLAIRDSNHLFAGITKLIEAMPAFKEEILDRAFFHFLENPLLQQSLPASAKLPVEFERFFQTSHTMRRRSGDSTTTLFGGVDWPLIISSGRSDSPNFYSFRKGRAVLQYMRLSSDFFSTGYFYSEGMHKEGEGYLLGKELSVPYYQPLPHRFRNSAGDYALSPSADGRFWNRMDFPHRPVSNVKTLDTAVVYSRVGEADQLRISVKGQTGVRVTLECCFREGGNLSGVTKANGGDYFLERGTGKYEYGGDVISFGPGAAGHHAVKDLEGELYSSHFGSLRTEGMHVYITGVTPFAHTITLE